MAAGRGGARPGPPRVPRSAPPSSWLPGGPPRPPAAPAARRLRHRPRAADPKSLALPPEVRAYAHFPEVSRDLRDPRMRPWPD